MSICVYNLTFQLHFTPLISCMINNKKNDRYLTDQIAIWHLQKAWKLMGCVVLLVLPKWRNQLGVRSSLEDVQLNILVTLLKFLLAYMLTTNCMIQLK